MPDLSVINSALKAHVDRVQTFVEENSFEKKILGRKMTLSESLMRARTIKMLRRHSFNILYDIAARNLCTALENDLNTTPTSLVFPPVIPMVGNGRATGAGIVTAIIMIAVIPVLWDWA